MVYSALCAYFLEFSFENAQLFSKFLDLICVISANGSIFGANGLQFRDSIQYIVGNRLLVVRVAFPVEEHDTVCHDAELIDSSVATINTKALCLGHDN